MAQNGAAEVVGVDFSPTNIESCRKRAAQKGLGNIRFEQHSVLDLPFANESFDVVWCNGVLHHTADPDRGLREITRVLGKGGRLWLYLYGVGGIYWYMVDWARYCLRDVDVGDCIDRLARLGDPVGRIAECIDDWFTGFLHRYTQGDVTRRLGELGYADTDRLRYGVSYDTSQRRVDADPTELALMGEGDLRYFCRKVGDNPSRDREGAGADPSEPGQPLPNPPDGRGSPWTDPPEVTRFGPTLARASEVLDAIEEREGHPIPDQRILVCRWVHRKVRSLVEAPGRFDCAALERHLAELSRGSSLT